MTDRTRQRMAEMKSCPFCGNKERFGAHRFGGPWSVECHICGCIGPSADTIEEAYDEWDIRVSE